MEFDVETPDLPKGLFPLRQQPSPGSRAGEIVWHTGWLHVFVLNNRRLGRRQINTDNLLPIALPNITYKLFWVRS